jgi:hypothetical protein
MMVISYGPLTDIAGERYRRDWPGLFPRNLRGAKGRGGRPADKAKLLEIMRRNDLTPALRS